MYAITDDSRKEIYILKRVVSGDWLGCNSPHLPFRVSQGTDMFLKVTWLCRLLLSSSERIKVRSEKSE